MKMTTKVVTVPVFGKFVYQKRMLMTVYLDRKTRHKFNCAKEGDVKIEFDPGWKDAGFSES